jgi:tRNA G46 methylase TrmB
MLREMKFFRAQMEIGFFPRSGLVPDKLAISLCHFSVCTLQPAGAKLILEIGCGRGEYTIELAKIHPRRLFVGAQFDTSTDLP